MSLNLGNAQNTITEYLKSPFVCGAIIGICAYYLYSGCYITKENIKSKFSIKKQRMANIKTAIYLFLISVLVIFIFRHLNNEKIEKFTGGMRVGNPPF